MTEKIGIIKNPLTIIAIFAGIAEVSGTIVLPFISVGNQLLFVYFLVAFPTLLVLVFFLTLNFNNKVLYAPSDYKNEENYIKIFKYDQSKQEQIEVKVNKDDSANLLFQEISNLKENINQRFLFLENRDIKDENIYIEDSFVFDDEKPLLIANMARAKLFINKMNKLGYSFGIYNSNQIEGSNINISKSLRDGKAIWLGKNIEFLKIKTILSEAKQFYPHLCYIHISGDLNDVSPSYSHNQIFVGGATDSATDMYKLKPLSNDQFNSILNSTSKDEMFTKIRLNYPDKIRF